MSKAILGRGLSRLAGAGVGLACALSAAALCGAGTFLLQSVPKFYRVHVGGVRWAPHWHTVWAYLLVAVMAVWLGHAVLRLRDEIARAGRDRRAGSRFWVALAAAQMGLVFALGAYVWLVVRPAEEEFVVTAHGTDIHGESYRAVRVDTSGRERQPRRPGAAWLERRVGAASERLRTERGLWWDSVTGSHQMAMARTDIVADGVIVRHGDRRVVLKQAQPEHVGSDTLSLRAVPDPGAEPSSRPPQADVTIGQQRSLLPLDPEWAGPTAFLGPNESPVVLVRVHRNLRAPLSAAVLTVLLVGAMLLWLHARRASPERRDGAP
jgi:hypothetical protein